MTDIGDAKFVSMTTYKRNGDAVATPMWLARDGAQLVMWTPEDAWKVKRLRRDPRVTLQESNRTGKVKPDAPVVTGTAEVVTEPGYVSKAENLIKKKYGLGFHIITRIEAILARGRKPRVAVRITEAS